MVEWIVPFSWSSSHSFCCLSFFDSKEIKQEERSLLMWKTVWWCFTWFYLRLDDQVVVDEFDGVVASRIDLASRLDERRLLTWLAKKSNQMENRTLLSRIRSSIYLLVLLSTYLNGLLRDSQRLGRGAIVQDDGRQTRRSIMAIFVSSKATIAP